MRKHEVAEKLGTEHKKTTGKSRSKSETKSNPNWNRVWLFFNKQTKPLPIQIQTSVVNKTTGEKSNV